MSTLKDRVADCARFLTSIWGLEDHNLYALVVVQTDPGTDDAKWHDFGFKWPKGQAAAVRRIFEAESAGANVYICPALFTKPERRREHVAGSYVLWMDSDGNAPQEFDGAVPTPSMRVQTSHERHVHDYWLLEDFLTDVDSLETANRSITAYFEADASGWDASQLLRPPGTTNRKQGLPVTLLASAL